MNAGIFPANRGRTLVIAPPSAAKVHVSQLARERPVVAMLASHAGDDLTEIESLVGVLLDHRCEYFVCFGTGSEVLHDRIDETLVERVDDTRSLDAVTTWHDDEPADDVAEFFLNVAGSKDAALLVAVLDSRDATLANALVQRVSLG